MRLNSVVWTAKRNHIDSRDNCVLANQYALTQIQKTYSFSALVEGLIRMIMMNIIFFFFVRKVDGQPRARKTAKQKLNYQGSPNFCFMFCYFLALGCLSSSR